MVRKIIVFISILIICFPILCDENEATQEETLQKIKKLSSSNKSSDENWYPDTINKKIHLDKNMHESLTDMIYSIVVGEEAVDITELNTVLKYLKLDSSEDENEPEIEDEEEEEVVVPKSLEKNFNEIKDKDYNYFYNLLNPFVNCPYPALVVESGKSLYKISSIYDQTFDESILTKLQYCASGTDSDNWDLEYTIYRDIKANSYHYKGICEEKGYDLEDFIKEKAITEIRKEAIRGLYLINSKESRKILIQIMKKEEEPRFMEDSFYIKKMIKNLLKNKR